MKLRLTILIALALALWPMTAGAALTAHYVTATGTGTWAQSTSKDTPTSYTGWLTNAAPGDLTYILTGAYSRSGAETPTNAGTIGAPIILQGVSSFDPLTLVEPQRINQGALSDTGMPVITYSGSGAGGQLTLKLYYTLRGVKLTGSQRNGLLTITNNVLIDSCIVNNTRVEAVASASAIAASNATGVKISNCDLLLTDATLQYGGVVSTVGTGCIIENCRITNASASASCVGLATGSNQVSAVIRGCVFAPSAGIGVASNSEWMLENNTFYGQAIAVTTPNAATKTIRIINNIFSNNGRALLNLYNATAAHHLISVGNLYYANTSPNLGYGDCPEYGRIDADPLFKDAANGDFRLIPTSPAISAGLMGNTLGATPRLYPTLAAAAQLTTGTQHGYTQDGLITGNVVIPAAGDVRQNTMFGPNRATTGTLEAGGGTRLWPWRFGH